MLLTSPSDVLTLESVEVCNKCILSLYSDHWELITKDRRVLLGRLEQGRYIITKLTLLNHHDTQYSQDIDHETPEATKIQNQLIEFSGTIIS